MWSLKESLLLEAPSKEKIEQYRKEKGIPSERGRINQYLKPGYFVHFMDFGDSGPNAGPSMGKLGINPKQAQSYNTPFGIYAYPAHTIGKDIFYPKVGDTGKIEKFRSNWGDKRNWPAFATEKDNVIFFMVDSSANIIYINSDGSSPSYDEEKLQEDFEKLNKNFNLDQLILQDLLKDTFFNKKDFFEYMVSAYLWTVKAPGLDFYNIETWHNRFRKRRKKLVEKWDKKLGEYDGIMKIAKALEAFGGNTFLEELAESWAQTKEQERDMKAIGRYSALSLASEAFAGEDPSQVLDFATIGRRNTKVSSYLSDMHATLKKLHELKDGNMIHLFENGTKLKTPVGILWYMTKVLADGDILKWRKVLKFLGYDGFVDDGSGLIHKNEPIQAVFFSKDIIEEVEEMKNPLGSMSHRRRAQGLTGIKGARRKLRGKAEHFAKDLYSLFDAFSDFVLHAKGEEGGLESLISESGAQLQKFKQLAKSKNSSLLNIDTIVKSLRSFRKVEKAVTTYPDGDGSDYLRKGYVNYLKILRYFASKIAKADPQGQEVQEIIDQMIYRIRNSKRMSRTIELSQKRTNTKNTFDNIDDIIDGYDALPHMPFDLKDVPDRVSRDRVSRAVKGKVNAIDSNIEDFDTKTKGKLKIQRLRLPIKPKEFKKRNKIPSLKRALESLHPTKLKF